MGVLKFVAHVGFMALTSHVPTTPRMVTHHWSNRFCDLVAAVLADALDLKRWDVVAGRLRSSEGVEELKDCGNAKALLFR